MKSIRASTPFHGTTRDKMTLRTNWFKEDSLPAGNGYSLNVCFGSLAAVQNSTTQTAAFGRIADIRQPYFGSPRLKFLNLERQLSAISRHRKFRPRQGFMFCPRFFFSSAGPRARSAKSIAFYASPISFWHLKIRGHPFNRDSVTCRKTLILEKFVAFRSGNER